MRKSAFCAAFAALSVMSAWTDGVWAATASITGSSLGANVNLDQNDVVNFAASGIFDLNNGSTWKQGGAVSSTVSSYNVDWYFNGAESGDTEKFSSMSLSFSESNQNNGFNSTDTSGWSYLGSTQGSGAGAVSFSVTDTSVVGGVTNGVNNAAPSPGASSLIFSYAEPLFRQLENGELVLFGWSLTLNPTDWFVFAFDDPGGTDADFDDYVGVGHITVASLTNTPLPGSLGLLLAVLTGGYFRTLWRRRSLRLSV
ncbi:MAG: hypothetical protein QM780_07655 [Hyphomicrobium sp.]|uniref:hypothetical protein n=1 Tax=Hyphomicrobium sp. TaxID=82 RepID=UPI0039E489BA